MRTPHGTRRERHRRGRKLLGAALAGAVATGGLLTTAYAGPAGSPEPAETRQDAAAVAQPENLGRGPVSVHEGDDNLVSWRLLADDPEDVAFNVYRGDTLVNDEPITGSTNFRHQGAPASADYRIKAVVDGQEQAFSAHAVQFRDGHLDVPVERPSGGSGYSYSANDASVGDLDGDGDLDLVLKWQPSNSKDNSQAGTTGSTIVDGYTLQGDRLWRIDLGRNIRAGAHYTQFQVFDYDGDGAAEVAMKTADGTRDGTGGVIGDSGADHRNGEGYVLEGPEYLTMFSGSDGAALDTVDYVPARGDVCAWGDCYGNRVDRFLAGTAYLDGSTPSLIMARGYYTRSVIAAWDFTNGQLEQRWVFDSDERGSQYAGQGSHSLSVGDVDADGRDEIVYGAMAVDDDGSGMWSTRTQHGDAQHLGDLDPADEGLEYFKVSESGGQPSSLFIDPANGDVRWQTGDGGDNGRGVAGNIWAGNDGAEMWSSADSAIRDAEGGTKGRKPSSANFLAWWDGDPVRELLDGTHIDKYGTSGDSRLLTASGVHSNNGTKSNPSLSGDILGDWREEVIWPTGDDSALRIYSTPVETDLKITTLLQDRMYRTGLAWQNTAYNQPPHPSFFLGDGS